MKRNLSKTDRLIFQKFQSQQNNIFHTGFCFRGWFLVLNPVIIRNAYINHT